MKPIYLIINLLTISFPLVRSFEPKIAYAKKWHALFPAIIVTATFFIIWDVIFTRSQVWGFNELYLIGISLFHLPIEEWLFFFTVPFASVFIYECVKFFLPKIRSNKIIRFITSILSLVLFFIAIWNHDKSYTFWNFTFASVLLIIISIRDPKWLASFWVAYGVHLIPFLLVNGILTGSFLSEPIVWYNNTHNLDVRIFTIPIEDTVYALTLLLMNITLFEFFLSKSQPNKAPTLDVK